MTFNVTVLPSGRSFTANPDEALLAAAIRQGIGMPYGCKDGACGSCKCKKLEGTIKQGTHQVKALTAEEAADGFILTCCATAETTLCWSRARSLTRAPSPSRRCRCAWPACPSLHTM
jgi:CDP-4-dehydro-6-deoxyglucose reductase